MENDFDFGDSHLLDSLTNHLSSLTDKFKVYESLCRDPEINNQSAEEEVKLLKLRLEEKENLYMSLKSDYQESEKISLKKLQEKDNLIESLRRELDLMKSERNDNINQMQNVLRDKFSKFNNRKGPMHSHHSSITSISSLSTHHDEKILEKLNVEKNNMEKQLIESKFQFTEILAKLDDLEGQYEKICSINKDLQNKLIYKDQILKKVIEERDHYKFSTNPHYAYNSCDFTPPDINEKQAQTVEYNNFEGANVKIVNEYITSTSNGGRLSTPKNNLKLDLIGQINRDDSCKYSDRPNTSRGSIIKYFKDLFN